MIKGDWDKVKLAQWRHNQQVELADWDALDLDELTCDREMWSGRGSGAEKGPGEGASSSL